MVPTLPFSISDFIPADTGNLAVPTPECPMAFSPGGSLAAVNGCSFAPGPFPNNRANQGIKQPNRVSAGPPRGQRGFHREDRR
jgi:hypothetical protein